MISNMLPETETKRPKEGITIKSVPSIYALIQCKSIRFHRQYQPLGSVTGRGVNKEFMPR